MSNRRVGKPSKKHDNKLEGTHHRGDDDAWNIAQILAHLLDEHGQEFLETFW
ncbi:MAG: hypothetical protein Q9P44_13055 [Anaerolineae bacterium]|nr:hypothetical protein [Anaerolineae bacterium]